MTTTLIACVYECPQVRELYGGLISLLLCSWPA